VIALGLGLPVFDAIEAYGQIVLEMPRQRADELRRRPRADNRSLLTRADNKFAASDRARFSSAAFLARLEEIRRA